VDRACAGAGLPAARLDEHGGRALERTAVLQPVLTAIALAVHQRLLDAGISGRYVLGHSLGELAAWCAMGAISPEDAIEAAALRGRLMQREAARRAGGMVAIVGGEEEVSRALALAPAVCIAGWNSPDEVVLAGPEDALLAISRALPSRRLAVGGAWHSPAMAGAVEELRAALRRVPRSAPSALFVSNTDGDVAPPDTIADRLADQLVRPARFAAALTRLHALGVRTFVTVGPGAVVRGLLRKNLEARALGTDDAADLSRTLESLSPSALRSHP
jgi:acyl transferase domain-containing protein